MNQPTKPLAPRAYRSEGLLLGAALLLVVGCQRPTPPPGRPATTVSEWPTRFGPTGDTHTPEPIELRDWTPAGPPEVWRREVGEGYSSPVVAGGLVVLMHRVGDEELVEGFDARTGATRWTHRYPTDFACPYEYSTGPYGTPVIHGGRVYSVGGTWQTRCLDLATGEVIWSRDLADDYPLERDGFPFGAGLWVDERVVFNLGSTEAGVIALDARTGETEWTATNHRPGYTTPVYAEPHGRPTLYVFTYEGLVALDPATGEVRWEEPFRSRAPLSYNATTPVAWDNRVLMVTGPGPGAVCLEEQPEGAPRTAWKDRRVLDSQFNPLMRAGGQVYGYTSSRNRQASLRCVDLETGELRWDYPSELKRGTGLVAGDKLLLLGESGHLAVLATDSDEPEPLYFSSAPLLEEPCYSGPALAGGLLYLRNCGNLVCYRARPKGEP